MDTIVGETEAVDSPGYVTFERDGQRLIASRRPVRRTDALVRLPRRHQRADDPRRCSAALRRCSQGRHVVLDFNKAVNLPCAYIPYATCPLAPAQNRLSLAIEAGELKYEPRRGDRSSGEAGR